MVTKTTDVPLTRFADEKSRKNQNEAKESRQDLARLIVRPFIVSSSSRNSCSLNAFPFCVNRKFIDVPSLNSHGYCFMSDQAILTLNSSPVFLKWSYIRTQQIFTNPIITLMVFEQGLLSEVVVPVCEVQNRLCPLQKPVAFNNLLNSLSQKVAVFKWELFIQLLDQAFHCGYLRLSIFAFNCRQRSKLQGVSADALIGHTVNSCFLPMRLAHLLDKRQHQL